MASGVECDLMPSWKLLGKVRYNLGSRLEVGVLFLFAGVILFSVLAACAFLFTQGRLDIGGDERGGVWANEKNRALSKIRSERYNSDMDLL